MANYKKWTQEELDFISNNYQAINDEELASRLSQITNSNVNTAMIRRQRRKLKLNKPRGRPSKNKIIVNAEQPLNLS
jgi:hypothetical protein